MFPWSFPFSSFSLLFHSCWSDFKFRTWEVAQLNINHFYQGSDPFWKPSLVPRRTTHHQKRKWLESHHFTISPSHLECFTLKFQSWSLRLVIWLRNGTRASGLLPCPHGCFQMIRTGLGNQRCRLTVFFASEADQASVEELLQKQEAAKKAEEASTDNPLFCSKLCPKSSSTVGPNRSKVFFHGKS